MAKVIEPAYAVVPKELSPQHLKFATLYAASGNATQAYIDAGYSPKGAQKHAHRLVANGGIAAEVDRLKAEYAKAAGIDRVWVLERMKAHIDAELTDVFDGNDMLLPTSKWPKHMRRLVDKVKVVQNRTGTVVVAKSGEIIHVPMYTKEVSLEAKAPILAKLLDWIAPTAPKEAEAAVVNNTQINIDKLLLALDTPIKREAE